MNRNLLISIGGSLVVATLVFSTLVDEQELTISDGVMYSAPGSQNSSSVENLTSLSGSRNPGSPDSELSSPTSRAKLVFDEVLMRLRERQTDEALNELNAMLEVYESLSEEDQGKVLLGYAEYFARASQVEDMLFFYEAALEKPGIRQDNRWAILQLMARYAARQEDWNRFLAYNDQYFAEGGEYTWIVATTLMGAYQQLEDTDSLGRTLLLHMEVGINPGFEGTELEYYERWGDVQSLPLSMTDSDAALELAQKLVNKFDGLDNWRVLADVLQTRGDEVALGQLMQDAIDRGYADANGVWQSTSQRRGRRMISRS